MKAEWPGIEPAVVTTTIRLRFDRATSIRRPTSRPYAYTCVRTAALLLLLLRLAPLRVRSATGCQQPPEWSVLGQVDCVGPRQPVGVQVVLHRLHPGHPRLSRWSQAIHRRRGSQDLLCVYIVVHSGDMPEYG